MAAPTTRKFGQIKVYVSNGASPEVFATPCGFTDKSLKISKDVVDTTLPDCDDPDAASWIGREVKTISGEISSSGVMAMESLATWRAWALASTAKNVRVEVSGTGAQGGGYFAGSMHLSDFELKVALGEKAQVSVTLVTDGALSWVAAA